MSKKQGYSVWTATIFMVSFNAGLGVLALPRSLAGTGWFGLLLIFLACVNSCYCAVILGKTWLVMEKRWEEYRGKFRYPYPAMGLRSVGLWMRYLVTAVLHISAIGIAVVYLLLSAQVAQSMTESLFSMGYKYWIIILAVILCPLTWFGSIEEFRFAGIGALSSMVLACLGMLVAIIMDGKEIQEVRYDDPTLMSMSLSFGTILFAFGGIFFFPTVQNDMKCKEQFPTAAILSFVVLLIMYLPVVITGYNVFGSDVNSSLVLSLSKGYLRTAIELCLAIHTFLAFLLGINPVLQELEEVLHVSPDFNYKRCIIRSLLVCIVLVIACTIPSFGKVLNLIGGSTITLLTSIFPPLFYFMIQKKDTKLNDSQKEIKSFEKLFLLQIVFIGIAGGISCTYFAVIDIVEIFYPYNNTATFNVSLVNNSDHHLI